MTFAPQPRPFNLDAFLARAKVTVWQLSLASGASNSILHRRRQYGLTPDTADRLAVSMGLHPVEVWPDWYEATEIGLVAPTPPRPPKPSRPRPRSAAAAGAVPPIVIARPYRAGGRRTGTRVPVVAVCPGSGHSPLDGLCPECQEPYSAGPTSRLLRLHGRRRVA